MQTSHALQVMKSHGHSTTELEFYEQLAYTTLPPHSTEPTAEDPTEEGIKIFFPDFVNFFMAELPSSSKSV